MKATVLGSGSWGTALANVLAENGHDVQLWGRKEGIVAQINTNHQNERYLPSVKLSENLRATTELSSALSGADFVLFAVPSKALGELAERALPLIPDQAVIVHAVKGFVRPLNKRVSQFLETLSPNILERLAVLSGPSHAEEVVRGMPTTVVVASQSERAALIVQDTLMNATFRVYTQADMIGVELGGTLKNIIALGVGLVDGLGLGDNTKAALMTRGLAEMTRLGIALGASPLTFSGLSGIGDLIVTCTSSHSRNFRAGRLLAKGNTLEETLLQIGMAVEGVGTTFAASDLAQSLGVEMPITRAIKRVLQGDISPEDATRELMVRDKNHEVEDVGQAPLAPNWKYPDSDCR